ncbi:MAG: aminotransferase class I/II-fold pyridoxal phosphate-dependent enzyme [Deltaproteobacteria bacterium]|nr:aminotransferase class I/II-fold pyridoxal phosphate-dependent enzyme [Deltaproteobacteria bacterium]
MKGRKKTEKGYHMETFLIHGKFRSEKWDYNHHVIPPITASTAFRLDSALRGQQGFIDFADAKYAARALSPIYIYDRLDEPTVGMLEDFLKEVEGGEAAVAFACGMAAISAALVVTAKTGSEIVAHRTLYGCTFSLMTNWLPKLGIKTKFVDMTDESEIRNAINEKVRAVYFETPSNPTLEIIDIEMVRRCVDEENARRGHKDKILVMVDNTFATPYIQRPLRHGADIVVESLTKNIGGFGVDMGGAVIVPERLRKSFRGYRKDFGGVLPPSNAWSIMVYGLPTLKLRIKRQEETAAKVAKFLSGHPAISKVSYPGLKNFPGLEIAKRQMCNLDGEFSPGTLIYFEVAGSLEDAGKRCGSLIDYIAENSYSITLAVSLGMIKTLIESPGLMTHCAYSADEQSRIGIHPGGVRLSIGLEDAEDIMRDLGEALNVISDCSQPL